MSIDATVSFSDNTKPSSNFILQRRRVDSMFEPDLPPFFDYSGSEQGGEFLQGPSSDGGDVFYTAEDYGPIGAFLAPNVPASPGRPGFDGSAHSYLVEKAPLTCSLKDIKLTDLEKGNAPSSLSKRSLSDSQFRAPQEQDVEAVKFSFGARRAHTVTSYSTPLPSLSERDDADSPQLILQECDDSDGSQYIPRLRKRRNTCQDDDQNRVLPGPRVTPHHRRSRSRSQSQPQDFIPGTQRPLKTRHQTVLGHPSHSTVSRSHMDADAKTEMEGAAASLKQAEYDSVFSFDSSGEQSVVEAPSLLPTNVTPCQPDPYPASRPILTEVATERASENPPTSTTPSSMSSSVATEQDDKVRPTSEKGTQKKTSTSAPANPTNTKEFCEHGKAFQGKESGHFCKGVSEKCYRPIRLHVTTDDGTQGPRSDPSAWGIKIGRQPHNETMDVITIHITAPDGTSELPRGFAWVFPLDAIKVANGQIKVAKTLGPDVDGRIVRWEVDEEGMKKEFMRQEILGYTCTKPTEERVVDAILQELFQS